jgi:hypothetical protein
MKVGLQPHGGGIITTAPGTKPHGLVLEGPLPTDVPE